MTGDLVFLFYSTERARASGHSVAEITGPGGEKKEISFNIASDLPDAGARGPSDKTLVWSGKPTDFRVIKRVDRPEPMSSQEYFDRALEL